MAYNPKNPMEDRISDIGPRHYGEFLPPVIKEKRHNTHPYIALSSANDCEKIIVSGFTY